MGQQRKDLILDMGTPRLTPPATPDFYSYPWTPLAQAVIDGDFVALTWPDGTGLPAHGWWLRECVVADGATDPVTRELTIDPADLPDDLTVTSVAVDDDGALAACWNDGFSGTLHPGWLRHVADGHHRSSAGLPTAIAWTAATMVEPPTFDGPGALTDDEELLAFLEAMVTFGVARLRTLPVDDTGRLDEEGQPVEGLARLTDRIGVRRRTNFGDLWNVKAEITGDHENAIANTGFRLGPHADLPTREVPPGFQLLHCVANTVAGGWSTMADGAALVAHLETEEPETYEALTTLRWVFFNRSRDHDHRWTGPMIDLGGRGRPLTLRAFYPVRGFPDMDRADVPRAYRAAKRFHQLAADPGFQIRYPFLPGDLIGFDNRRMLHGRDVFDPGTGVRHLRGTYVDHDEIHSRLRVLRRHTRLTDSAPDGPASIETGRRSASTENHDKEFAP